MSPFEIAGTILGVIGVWLMIVQNVWTWPVGLVQVAIYAWVFYDAKLYSDAILQVFFFVIQAYGWWHWRRSRGQARAELPVTRLGLSARLGWIAVGAVGTIGWGEFMRRSTDAALPHWDAFILSFALIAQWLQARKRIENWTGWIAVNAVGIGVYWAKDLRLTSALYVVFLVMAVLGHVAWKKSMNRPAVAHD
jgi:nicotinamide mononucleotide transporter